MLEITACSKSDLKSGEVLRVPTASASWNSLNTGCFDRRPIQPSVPVQKMPSASAQLSVPSRYSFALSRRGTAP